MATFEWLTQKKDIIQVSWNHLLYPLIGVSYLESTEVTVDTDSDE